MATVILSIIAAFSVFVIAAVVLGREARRLDAIAPRAVYEIGEAAGFVAAALPPSTQARLTPGELRALLVAHMRWLHARGLQPDGITDRPQDIESLVVVDGTTVAAHLLGEAARLNVEVLDDVDVVRVVDAHIAYFAAIGAVGPPDADGRG